MKKNNAKVAHDSDKKLKRADSIELCPKHYFSLRRQISVINHTPCNLYIILTVDPDTLVLRGVGGNVGAGVGTWAARCRAGPTCRWAPAACRRKSRAWPQASGPTST